MQRDDQRPRPDHQRHAVFADSVHFRLAFLSRLALGVTEIEKGNEMEVSGFTTVCPWSGLAKYGDPATALIHASEMERLGPGPVTPIWMVPMAAEVVELRRSATLAVVVAAVVAPAVVPVRRAAVGATAAPLNVWTLALAGVIEIRWLRASGQSTAELRTDARRATPAE